MIKFDFKDVRERPGVVKLTDSAKGKHGFAFIDDDGNIIFQHKDKDGYMQAVITTDLDLVVGMFVKKDDRIIPSREGAFHIPLGKLETMTRMT